ncbi:L,D-transpeptidase [Actinomycetospora atypica]|uniref:L,D-transpeptidase n=1 Tax=Actinomycetospora atypica TaxID=1290095 RepID=A0ABV9YMQ4_9PSEU
MTRIGAAGSAVAVLGVLGVSAGLTMTGPAPAPVADRAIAQAPAAASPVAAPITADVTTLPTTTTAPRTTTTKAAAKRTTAKPTTTTAATKQSSGMPCSISGDGACVDLSAKRVWLVQDGEVVRSAPMTSGRPGERTPTGTFHVTWKDADHRSSEFNDAPMPWSVFFNGGIAFHTGSLSRQSAGCIHLSDSVARTFFRTLSVGDTVVVVR